MSKGIRIHPEFGLNSSMCVCFYCGEPTNEIVLFGAGYRKKNSSGRMVSAEAPRYTCNSIEPCDTCKEKYLDEYVLIVEAEEAETPHPTGRWFALRKTLLNEEFRDKPVAFMESTLFSQIIMEVRHDERT